MPSPITTHVLDTSKGRPAAGLRVRIELQEPSSSSHNHLLWKLIGDGITDSDGRISTLLPSDFKLVPGIYRITFETGAYQKGFYPSVSINFEVIDAQEHYHVPLLLNPYGYSTYRGS